MKRLLFAGIVAFAVVLAVTFPAHIAFRWFAPPEVQLSGISGSVWNGEASEGLVADAYLTDIRWRLQPGALFNGTLSFAAEAKPVGGALATVVSTGADGAVTLTGLSARLPLDLVLPEFQALGINGDIAVAFDKLVLVRGIPAEAIGAVTVGNLYAPYLSAGVLGDYQLVFANSNDGVQATLDDLTGVLDVIGTLVVEADGSYRLDGLVKARPEAPPSVEAQLALLGPPDVNGMRPFGREGVL